MDCIWMTSELVKYKYCDKNLDCDNCEFDKVMRNLSAKHENNQLAKTKNDLNNEDLLERLIKRIEAEAFDDKIIYLKNQLVLKNLFGNAYYLGINPVVLCLLDDYNSIHEFNVSQIKRDQIIFTLEGGWGIKQFISPINFMIIEKINFSRFKLNKWYAIILFNETDKDDFWISEKEWNRKKNNAVSSIRKFVTDKPQIGKSMLDGGEKVKYLHQYLGSSLYLELLQYVFR